MSELKPTILIDSRERAPLHIEAYPTERVGLPVGDYGIECFSDWQNPRFIVERKSLSDLAGSLGHGRDRFMREMEKLRQFAFRGLLIEGTHDDVALGRCRSAMHPSAIWATLDALSVRAGLHVFWCGDATGAARQLESLVRQFVRGIQKDSALLKKHAQGTPEARSGSKEHVAA